MPPRPGMKPLPFPRETHQGSAHRQPRCRMPRAPVVHCRLTERGDRTGNRGVQGEQFLLWPLNNQGIHVDSTETSVSPLSMRRFLPAIVTGSKVSTLMLKMRISVSGRDRRRILEKGSSSSNGRSRYKACPIFSVESFTKTI